MAVIEGGTYDGVEYDVEFCYFKLNRHAESECAEPQDVMMCMFDDEHNDPYANNKAYEFVGQNNRDVKCLNEKHQSFLYGTEHHIYYKRIGSGEDNEKKYCFKEQKQNNKNRSDYGQTRWVRDTSCDGQCN